MKSNKTEFYTKLFNEIYERVEPNYLPDGHVIIKYSNDLIHFLQTEGIRFNFQDANAVIMNEDIAVWFRLKNNN